MKFKLKDRVKLVQLTSDCLDGYKLGDIVTINKIDSDGEEPTYRVAHDTTECKNDFGWANTNDLELVIDKEIIELTVQPPEGYEIDEETSTFQKIVFKKVEKKEVKCWEDLGEITGYFVNNSSAVIEVQAGGSDWWDWRNIFATKEQAEASIALAMLSQLMKNANGDWKPNWSSSYEKYIISWFKGSITTTSLSYSQHFLSFPTPEIRDKFLENHRELIEQAKPLL